MTTNFWHNYSILKVADPATAYIYWRCVLDDRRYWHGPPNVLTMSEVSEHLKRHARWPCTKHQECKLLNGHLHTHCWNIVRDHGCILWSEL